MTTMTFDTYAFVKRLKESGISENQAEAHVRALSDISLTNVATKGDIENLKAATRTDIENLKAATRTDIEKLKQNIQRLELKFGEFKADILKWIIPLLLAQVALFSSLAKWIV